MSAVTPRRRLRRSDCSGPGFRRLRRGRGFSYVDDEGSPIADAEVIERLRIGSERPPMRTTALVSPPSAARLEAAVLDLLGEDTDSPALSRLAG